VSSVRLRNFKTKLFHWEYWPFGIIQMPLFVMWVWYAIKERSIFYFSASNPSIPTGGMMGESKYDVLQLVPESVKPKTVLIKLPADTESVMQALAAKGLKFPLVFKPDMGERGWMVRKIKSQDDVTQYLREIKIDFIVQEWVDLPLEFGVYYVRFPEKANGFVNSITGKKFLTITGDGERTLQQLIMANDRAMLQWKILQEKYHPQLATILPAGENLELVSIGNHCLGTTFINANHLITPRLCASFDSISKQIKGFYFGRFDLRCATLQDLENGNVKIVELNGCGAEPAHIYHPHASLWAGLRDLICHWQNMYIVSKQNHQRGVPYLSFAEGKKIYKTFKAAQLS